MRDYLRSLNAEQRSAATTIAGPLLVLAGAGSGKTRVITVRIAHMLSEGIAPESVLATTFTNKAAAEMRERVAGLVGAERAKALTVGTFHSVCVRVLREFGAAVGLPRTFAICDTGDQQSALRAALRELHVSESAIQPRALGALISLAKNRLETPDTWLAKAADDRDLLVGRAWQRYAEHLARTRTVDFDDLLVKTLEVLRADRAARDALRARFAYCLVDEYQDTNQPQFQILRELCDGHRNICAVGDDDQSIYGWRGADVRLILDFAKHFPEARVVRLGTNYRSTPQILELAQRVIRNNPERHDKDLRSALPDGPPVGVVALEDEMAEAEWVVERIAEAVRDKQARLGDFAVLFRTAVQPRAFEEVLRARGLPYVLVGGMSFFDRKEVRDVLAYVKLCANPNDEIALLRIVNTPPRGVGKATLERVLAHATARGISAAQAFAEAAANAGAVAGAAPAAVAVVERLRARLAALAPALEGAELVSGLRRLVEEVAYKSELERLYADPRTRQLRWAAVLELYNLAEGYVRREARPTLAGFLERVTLQASDEGDVELGQRDAVTLMTLHAAKGLEFPRVFLVGFEEGLLPHARALAEDSVEEERRLVYVGITRAKFMLTLTWAASRARQGARQPTFPSRFYYELKGQAPPPEWQPAAAEREVSIAARASGAKSGARRAKGAAKLAKPAQRAPARRRAPKGRA